MGLPYIDDLNAPNAQPHGCTKMYYTFDQWGQRSSTLTAFLPSTLVHARHDRLHICTNAIATQIKIEQKDHELVAEGVRISSPDGNQVHLVRARHEVILTAGAIFSPHLLMLR